MSIFELGLEIDKSNAYMKFGKNQITNDLVIVSTRANTWAAAILVAIFVSFARQKPVFELGQEIDKSNPYMKFGRNQETKDQVIVSTKVDGQVEY